MNYLVGAAIFFGGMFLLFWLVDYQPRIKGPSTGESCVAFVDRMFGTGGPRTKGEERDLELCRRAHD
jgi:hypothetical protein